MKAIVKKGFATRLRGYNVGQTIEVSESEYKDFANFLELTPESEVVSNEPVEKTKKKKGK